MVLTSFLPLLPVNWWWVRIGDFPRVQLLIGTLIAMGSLAPYWRRRFTKSLFLLLLVGVGIQVYWIAPYLPWAPVEVEDAQSQDESSHMRILSANVLQENERADALLKLISEVDPDLITLCEVNQRWVDALSVLEKDYPHFITHPLDNTYGMAIYSRLPLVDPQVRTLVKETIPSIDTRVRLPSGHEARVFVVHPNPPRPGESTTKRDAELILVGREIEEEQSAIVMGDLNDVGWSRTTNLFQEVSDLLDPRKGRGLYPTYNAKSMIWRYPLDYCFHSDDFRLVQMETLRDIGSDHFPLYVELSHEPAAEDEQEAPHLDEGDREDAQEAVETAKDEGE